MERKAYGDAYKAGVAKGDEWTKNIKDKFNVDNLLGGNYAEDMTGAFTGLELGAIDLSGAETDAGLMNGVSDIAVSAGAAADSTEEIADSVTVTDDEELKYLREIAERETVNKFTTAEIKLDFTSNATLNSDIDLDGFINTFMAELGQTLVTAAEGLEQ